jgi:hypothetical protein
LGHPGGSRLRRGVLDLRYSCATVLSASVTSKQQRGFAPRSQRSRTDTPANSAIRVSTMRHASGWSGVTAASGQPYPRMARPPPRNRPELFAFDHHVLERPASASCNERTTSAPSPTADATRFVEPLRTSPMAKTSGRVVSRSNGSPPLPSRCSVKLG